MPCSLALQAFPDPTFACSSIPKSHILKTAQRFYQTLQWRYAKLGGIGPWISLLTRRKSEYELLSAKRDKSSGLSIVESIQQSQRSLCDKLLAIASMLSLLIMAFYE